MALKPKASTRKNLSIPGPTTHTTEGSAGQKEHCDGRTIVLNTLPEWPKERPRPDELVERGKDAGVAGTTGASAFGAPSVDDVAGVVVGAAIESDAGIVAVVEAVEEEVSEAAAAETEVEAPPSVGAAGVVLAVTEATKLAAVDDTAAAAAALRRMVC